MHSEQDKHLWHRLLGGPASESGTLCHGDGSCGIGSSGGQRLSLAPYVAGTGATRGGPPPVGANVSYPLRKDEHQLELTTTMRPAQDGEGAAFERVVSTGDRDARRQPRGRRGPDSRRCYIMSTWWRWSAPSGG